MSPLPPITTIFMAALLAAPSHWCQRIVNQTPTILLSQPQKRFDRTHAPHMNHDTGDRIFVFGNVEFKHAIIVPILTPAVLEPSDSISQSGANPLPDLGGRPHALRLA